MLDAQMPEPIVPPGPPISPPPLEDPDGTPPGPVEVPPPSDPMPDPPPLRM